MNRTFSSLAAFVASLLIVQVSSQSHQDVHSAPETKLASWRRPVYEPSTIDNDGTSANRYDVRKTLAYVVNDTSNVNNVFMLHWITTEDGEKYHLTTNAGVVGDAMVGSFVSLNNMQTKTAQGGSNLIPGNANDKHLSIRSAAQNITSPTNGDGWTNSTLKLDLAGVRLEISIRPTGTNFYYGGNGGIQLLSPNDSDDYSTAIPGWSWYWANPTVRINGTLALNGGPAKKIVEDESYSLFERQWGSFNTVDGYVALWFYLESGEVLISWCMDPTMNGTFDVAFASIWHPSGWHEMIPVGDESRFWNIEKSNVTGKYYFNDFFLDLPARNASFTFHKWIKDGELITMQGQEYITISESYGQGTAQWNGKNISVYGHVEQQSFLQ